MCLTESEEEQERGVYELKKMFGRKIAAGE